MRPSISYSVSPAFNQYYDTYEVISADGLTTTEVDYTRFEQSIFGSPTNNYSSAIGISISNNFEAKVRDRDSTVVEPKKITLINNLNCSTSYNLAGDSLNWSPVRVNGGFNKWIGLFGIIDGLRIDCGQDQQHNDDRKYCFVCGDIACSCCGYSGAFDSR